MKRIALLVLVALAGCPAPKPGVPTRVVRDLEGREVSVPVEVRRVVSIVPSVTELTFAAGAGDLVVGDTTYCDYPPEAKDRPKVGDIRVNYEAVVALKPDLVVSSHDLAARSNEQLRGLGLPVLCVDPKSIAEIGTAIRLLGDVTRRAEVAEKSAKDFETRVAEILRRVRNVERRPTVYIEATSQPHAAAPGMTADEIIRLAGGTNIITESYAGKWIPISWELVLSRDPEFIVVAHNYAPHPRERPGWEGLRAVKSGRVFDWDKSHFMYPTPRLARGLELLAKELHPECFHASDR
ncbi:MAG TPA: helical backbone metal receptor [Planctomycetota bacterium]|nr:helical backbone metal receptor [Planctomycetota bacterium]